MSQRTRLFGLWVWREREINRQWAVAIACGDDLEQAAKNIVDRVFDAYSFYASRISRNNYSLN